MLAAFPPPGLATPSRGNTPIRPQSTWPVVDDPGADQDASRSRKRRRCCGLPCWGFLLVMLTLIIIAAAVVVPLELLVLHKPKPHSTTAVGSLQACSQNNATACQNGGTSSISTGTCSCICINGFTGSTCSVAGASGCTTTTIEPTLTNVTLGDSIPRLIAAAQTNFSIPLFSTVILARFNSASLSCVSENALVTFDGESQRVGAAQDVARPAATSSSAAAAPTLASNKLRRDAAYSSSTTAPAAAAATANGIIYDPSTPYTTTDSTPAAISATAASQASASASASPAAVFSITEEVLDFARVAVLFVLQQEELDAAVSAQSSLQHFFGLESFTNGAARNISLGNGNTANLLDFNLDLGNGSVGSNALASRKRGLSGRRSVDLWSVPV